MKLALRLAVALAILALAWLTWRRTDRAPSAAAMPAARAEPRSPIAPLDEPLAQVLELTPASEPLLEREAARSEVVDVTRPSGGARDSAALVKVHVVSTETGEAVGGESLLAAANKSGGWTSKRATGSHADIGQAAFTDANGRAELEVNPGMQLYVILLRWVQERRIVDVPELVAGEVREVELRVPNAPDLAFFGRIVDDATGLAIADGLVRFDVRERDQAIPGEVSARADGTFDLHVRSWRQHFASAVANGYARTVFALAPDHEAAARAFEIRLSRAATLEVFVFDREQPAPDRKVELRCRDSYGGQFGNSYIGGTGDVGWSGTTDATGRVELGGLQPNFAWTLTVSVRSGYPRVEIHDINLDPGEHRRIDAVAGLGTTIDGRIEDAAGRPLAGCKIWRVETEELLPRAFAEREHVAMSAQSDERGRFRFEDVPAGDWLIGPEPTIAALAKPVRVDESMRQIEVVVRVEPYFWIKGVVLEENGPPAQHCLVEASSAGAPSNLDCTTDEEGRFEIGPMAAGTYTLWAGGGGSTYAHSTPNDVRAGDENVLLRVQPGASIRGRVVDANGKLQACMLMLARRGEDFDFIESTTHDGMLRLDNQHAGSYCLSASTRDGLFGFAADLQLRAGELLDDVQVVLQPGATLNLRYEGDERYCNAVVTIDGYAVSVSSHERGTTKPHVVPAGPIEVHWHSGPRVVESTQPVSLAAGEEREIVWHGKP